MHWLCNDTKKGQDLNTETSTHFRRLRFRCTSDIFGVLSNNTKAGGRSLLVSVFFYLPFSSCIETDVLSASKLGSFAIVNDIDS